MPIYQIKNVSNSAKVGIWNITESLEVLLNNYKEKGFLGEIYNTKNKQRLKQWLATRLLLSEFFEGVNINYDKLGKPHLDNDWFISISHSKKFVAIILNNKGHCGIDIEKIAPKVERIKHKFLNPLDLQNVTSLENLTTYWGGKEALYKYYGREEVLFIEHLFINNFSEKKSSFDGKIELDNYKKEIQMTYEKIEDYILVYTL